MNQTRRSELTLTMFQIPEQPPQYSEFEVTQAMSGEYKIQLFGKDAGNMNYLWEVKPPTLKSPWNKYFGLTERAALWIQAKLR